MKKILRLKSLEKMPEETKRIYDLTRHSCESFNAYYLDFFGSIDILQEQSAQFDAQGETKKAREAEEKIVYMREKIVELHGFMLDLAQRMSDFVELVEV